MTVRFVEGWDHFVQADIGQKWNIAGGNTSMVAGRFGGQALRTTGNSVGPGKALPSTYSTFVVGFAFRTSDVTHLNQGILKLMDAAGTTAIAWIALATGGKIQVQNSGNTANATGTKVLLANTWYYIEVKIVVNGASGSVATQIDGTSDIATTTINFGSTNIGHVDIVEWSGAGAPTWDYDDMYGDDANILGPQRVDWLKPASAGASTQWTPNASTNVSRLNEASGTFPDGDTTYNSDATSGHIDEFSMDNAAGSNVNAVQVSHWARKDDAGTRQIQTVIRQGGIDYSPGATFTLAATYVFLVDLFTTDPLGSAWTVSTINGDQFGVKVV